MKTSLEIPEDLWRAAKIRAVEEGKKLSELVAEAIAERLAKPKRTPRGKEAKR